MKAPGPGQCHMGLCQDECRGGNGCLVLNRAKDGLPTNDMGRASTFSSPTFELLFQEQTFQNFLTENGNHFFFQTSTKWDLLGCQQHFRPRPLRWWSLQLMRFVMFKVSRCFSFGRFGVDRYVLQFIFCFQHLIL